MFFDQLGQQLRAVNLHAIDRTALHAEVVIDENHGHEALAAGQRREQVHAGLTRAIDRDPLTRTRLPQ